MTGSSRVACFGSKATTGLCQPIIAMMPPHDTYIETHLGGGAIMKRKPAALHNIGIDLDGRASGERLTATTPYNAFTAARTGFWPSTTIGARSWSTATRPT